MPHLQGPQSDLILKNSSESLELIIICNRSCTHYCWSGCTKEVLLTYPSVNPVSLCSLDQPLIIYYMETKPSKKTFPSSTQLGQYVL